MDVTWKHLHVLIVDDDEAVCTRLAGILRKTGCATSEAETAEDAIALVEAQPLDAVPMDIQLPGRSGLDALTDISLSHPNLPILLVTGRIDGIVAKSQAMMDVAFFARIRSAAHRFAE